MMNVSYDLRSNLLENGTRVSIDCVKIGHYKPAVPIFFPCVPQNQNLGLKSENNFE